MARRTHTDNACRAPGPAGRPSAAGRGAAMSRSRPASRPGRGCSDGCPPGCHSATRRPRGDAGLHGPALPGPAASRCARPDRAALPTSARHAGGPQVPATCVTSRPTQATGPARPVSWTMSCHVSSKVCPQVRFNLLPDLRALTRAALRRAPMATPPRHAPSSARDVLARHRRPRRVDRPVPLPRRQCRPHERGMALPQAGQDLRRLDPGLRRSSIHAQAARSPRTTPTCAQLARRARHGLPVQIQTGPDPSGPSRQEARPETARRPRATDLPAPGGPCQWSWDATVRVRSISE